MKTTRTRGMLAALALAAVAQWSAPAAAEIRWQFFGGLPTTHAYAQQIMAGLERVKERSGGELQIQYSYYGETPYKQVEALGLVRDGLVQMTEWLPANSVSTYPILAAPELPFVAPTKGSAADLQGAINRAWDTPAMTEALGAIVAEHGAQVLARYYYQPMNFWAAKPLAKAEDFKGLKVRIFTPETAEFLEQLGAQPMNVTQPEVYTSLQTNVLDGVVTGSGNVIGSKWNEILNAGYIVNMMLVGSRMIVAEAALAELPPELRAILLEEMAAVGAGLQAFMPESDRNSQDTMAAAGMTVTQASDADYARYREIAQTEVWPGWKARVGEQADAVMKQIEDALK
jgi:TRAP-type C4-dicarboxylate transport system substrate-binding protein